MQRRFLLFSIGLALLAPLDARAIDTGAHQVHIRANVVEVQRSALEQLGIDWNQTFVNAGRELKKLPSLAELLAGADAEVLARPSVVTNSGHGRTFDIGEDSGPLRDFVVQLDVVPTVSGDRRFIQLDLVLRVDELPVPTGQPPIAPRTAQSSAVVENGGTVAIGGIFDADRSAVPWLDDLPVIGTLFRTRADPQARSLIVLVTPWILDPDGNRSSATRAMPQVHRPRPDPNVKGPHVPNQPNQPNTPNTPNVPNYPYGPSDRLNP